MALREQLLQLAGGEYLLEFGEIGLLHFNARLLSSQSSLNLLDNLGIRGSGLLLGLRLFPCGLSLVALLPALVFLVASLALGRSLVERFLIFLVQGDELCAGLIIEHQALRKALGAVFLAAILLLGTTLGGTGLRLTLGSDLCAGLRLLGFLFGLLGHRCAGEGENRHGEKKHLLHGVVSDFVG